ncbi:ester cyclase [Paracoccus sediminicola]|uniref:ester cyclase n=1 Tax=Paracoccus sediminicola TaxID=3017783 RepID=UPI0022F0FBC5|nr:ester cyclase [Paracoccus sediminicola]WBU55704.1 ester cyclase [Paracoccus sediminicola]
MTDPHLSRKIDMHEAMLRLAEARPEALPELLGTLYAPEAHWRGSHPMNEMTGPEAIAAQVWAPLRHSFPDLERRDLIVVGGQYEGRDYVAMMGHYCGSFRHDWLGIPATGGAAYLRYGEVHQIAHGRIVQSSCLWDVLDLIRQAGFWPLAPSLGAEEMWPGPITGDGLALRDSDPQESAASIAQTLAMHAALGAYDDEGRGGREGLLNMPQKDFWHPKMMWYGPAGIGTARGLSGFVDCHQLPFRMAFPNRKGGGQWDEIGALKQQHGGGHYIRIGDGPYSVTAGWPSVFAMHRGGGFLGLAPTGRPVTMRVMDFYLHHEGLIRENWVPLDMLDLLMQMGVDVLDRMSPIFRRGG